jgi:anti-sigma B factor antagonist
MAVNRDVVLGDDLNQLELVTRKQGSTMTIGLSGELDIASAPAARQAIAEALSGHPECVVLDLSGLAFIDSSGLHATVELARRSSAQNIRLVIIPGPSAVQRVFEITGLTERLPFITQQQTGSRAARSRSARDGVAGSGGPPPPNGAGRRPHAAGAVASIHIPPAEAAAIAPASRRCPAPAQESGHSTNHHDAGRGFQ